MFDDNSDDDDDEPREPWQGEDENEEVILCPICKSKVPWDETHCPTCGSYMRLDSEEA